MSERQAILVLGALLLICVSLQGAPVKEQAEKKSALPALDDVQGEDEDLQELLSLVNKQAHQDDVMVHQEHVTHIENNNGQRVKIEQKVEKVVDTDSGKVIADVKQQTQTEKSGQDAEPETVVKTKVDIPAEGVHETFVQGQQAPKSEEAGADTASEEDGETGTEPDLTPADMAAYLYATQQFEAFYTAIDKLVNESKMSVEDAQEYAKTVAMEYEQLQLQDLEDQYQLERRAFQQPLPESDFFGAGPAYNRYPNQPMDSIMPVPESPEPGFDMLGYVNSLMSPEEQDYIAQRQLQAELLSAFNNDPYKFVTALWKEAFDNGNVEAQEIVRLLYDRVRQNSNPADIREINDILMETLAQSLSEDTPYAYDTPIFPPVALPEVPIQPSVNEEAELNSQENVVGSQEMKEEEEEEEEEQKEETQEEEASEEKEEEKSEEEDKSEEAKEDSNGEENVEEKEDKEEEKH